MVTLLLFGSGRGRIEGMLVGGSGGENDLFSLKL